MNSEPEAHRLSIVDQFASALDREDYESAIRFLSTECQYDSPTGRIEGAERIIGSYAGNGAAAQKQFDGFEFAHRVHAESETGFVITYLDDVTIGGKTHRYQCQQMVQFEGELITYIEHREIPGEREKLNQFIESQANASRNA